MRNDESLPSNPEELLAHAGWVRSLARSLVGDPSLADDVVQETWIAALERPPRDRQALSAWLRRVVLNFARKALREGSRRSRRERAAARPECLDSREDLVTRVELHRQVVDAVLGLRDPYRETIILRFFEELSVREIADRARLPEPTVRTRLRRAVG